MSDDTNNDAHEHRDGIEVTVLVSVHGDPVPAEALLDHVEQAVQEYGMCLVGDYVDGAPVTYTVGLNKRRLPDIITMGGCICRDEAVLELGARQLRVGAFDNPHVTQVHGDMVRLSAWPYAARLGMFNTYYARYSDVPSLLLAETIT